MTKKAMIEALVNRGVEVNSKMKKEEVEAMYEAIFKTEAEVNVINPMEAHVEAETHVKNLEDMEAIISGNMLTASINAYYTAEAFYRIKEAKLYEVLRDEEDKPCKSFKSYVNDFRGGEVFGIKYSMAMHYVNLYKYVYPQREVFRIWGTHLLVNLIKPLKDEETRGIVLEAVDDMRLTEDMTAKEFKTALDAILGNTAEEVDGMEAEAEVEEGGYESSDTCDISEEALDEAVEIMEDFLECNAHDNTVTEAWWRILKALDR